MTPNPSNPPNPPDRPRRLAARETRDRLIAAAQALFERRGFAASTTREIAERAGVPEKMIYRHFGSKAGLFDESFAAILRGFVDDFATRWPDATDPTRLTDLTRRYVTELLTLSMRHRRMLTDVVTLGLGATGGTVAQSRHAFDGLFDRLVALAAGEADALAMPVAESARNVRLTIGLVLATALLRDLLYAADPPETDILVEELTAFVLHGADLAPTGSRPRRTGRTKAAP